MIGFGHIAPNILTLSIDLSISIPPGSFTIIVSAEGVKMFHPGLHSDKKATRLEPVRGRRSLSKAVQTLRPRELRRKVRPAEL